MLSYSISCSPTVHEIQQIFTRTRSGINIFGRENSGRPNKSNVMGWHTAVILALMPEIGMKLGLSSAELLRYTKLVSKHAGYDFKSVEKWTKK